jgi:pyridoxal 5'-phosphate synthase pdxT subunit
MKIGVLALQGDFDEHVQVLKSLAVDACEVRKPEQLSDLDGLVIPGGESTTFGKLAEEFGLIKPIREMCETGKPVWGTCAGMIFLAKDVGRPQPILGVMDVKVKRNAFGRQTESFEQDLDIPELNSVKDGGERGRPFHAIFIRAPLIESVGKRVQVLARLEDGTIVAARQGNLLVTSFHPELTKDTRIHKYFLEQVGSGR